jgi:FkbM family methyltransferase
VRLRDFADYWRLRRILVTPWAFLRVRKRGFAEPWREFPLKGGGRIRVRNAPMDMHIMHRVLGRDEYRLDAFRPGELDTVVDVGGHLGFFAVRAAPLARRVLTFEPFEENFEILSGNVAHLPNVKPVRMAVGPDEGEQEFHVSEIPSAGTFFPVERHPTVKVVRVPTVTLSAAFRDQGVTSCDLLKIDAEGAEYPILHSMPAGLWPRIRRICLEYDPLPAPPPKWTGEGLEELLRRAGYRVRRVPSKHPPGKGRLWAVRADERPHTWC